MNKLRFIIFSAAVALLTAGCGGKGAGNSEKESANSAQAEMQSTESEVVTPQDVPFEPAAMPQLQPLDKLNPDDMTGVKAQGFYGKVKTVKIKGHPEYGDFSFEFDNEGKIIKSNNYNYNSFTYKYSNATNYTDSYHNYRITFNATSRKDMSEYKKIEYKFDSFGRLISFEYSEDNGNMGGGSVFAYSKANAFPDKESRSIMTQDGDWNSDVKYKYKEFDKHGNWTKRNATLATSGWAEDENGDMKEVKETKTFKQTAEYTYYE